MTSFIKNVAKNSFSADRQADFQHKYGNFKTAQDPQNAQHLPCTILRLPRNYQILRMRCAILRSYVSAIGAEQIYFETGENPVGPRKIIVQRLKLYTVNHNKFASVNFRESRIFDLFATCYFRESGYEHEKKNSAIF